MADLDMLANILRSGAQGEAKLAGLDQDYDRALDLQTRQSAKPNQYGYSSPMGVLSDVINKSRGRSQARKLRPQQEAARLQVAEGQNAFPMYQAQQGQENFETGEANKLAAASALAQAKVKAKQDQITRENQGGQALTKTDKEGNEVTLLHNAKSGVTTLNGDRVNLGDYRNPISKSTVKNTGGAGYGSKDIDSAGRKALTAMSKTHRMAEIGGTLNETDRAKLNDSSDLFKQVMVSTFTPSKLQALVKDNLSGYSQEAKNFIVGVARMSAEERHELFGAALTPTEKESSEDFMARVEGLSFDQMMARMKDSYAARNEELKVLDALGGGDQFTGAVGRMGWTAFDPKAPAPTGLEFEDAEEAEYQAWKAAQGKQ